jgi:hypothetical protein
MEDAKKIENKSENKPEMHGASMNDELEIIELEHRPWPFDPHPFPNLKCKPPP